MTRGAQTTFAGPVAVHFGGRRSREFSHPFTCEALSACRARRMRRSRSMPGGVPWASLRSLAAFSASRLSDRLNGRFCMALSLFHLGRERNRAFSSPITVSSHAVIEENGSPGERFLITEPRRTIRSCGVPKRSPDAGDAPGSSGRCRLGGRRRLQNIDRERSFRKVSGTSFMV